MATAFARWDNLFNAVSKQDQADSITVFDSGKGEQGTQFANGLSLLTGFVMQHGRRDIHQQIKELFPFLNEALYMGFTGPGGDSPIHCPDIITGFVYPNVLKFNAPTTEYRPVCTGEQVLHRLPALEFKQVQDVLDIV
jgi:hypothetical protein